MPSVVSAPEPRAEDEAGPVFSVWGSLSPPTSSLSDLPAQGLSSILYGLQRKEFGGPSERRAHSQPSPEAREGHQPNSQAAASEM
jgi:hypothetical protein